MGTEIAGESQFVGYPTQFPSVSMVDWETGAPNARFRVLELLKNSFGPGDKLVATTGTPDFVHAQGFTTRSGKHLLLLISKRDRGIDVAIANYAASPIEQVPVSQFKVVGGYTYAGANGVASGLWRTDHNNFMPRLGLAYSINPKTVVRSGFGFFYDQLGIRNRHGHAGSYVL